VKKVSGQYALASAACAAIFVWGSIATLLGSILPSLSTRADLTITQAGHVFLGNGLGLVVASLVAGPLIDVWGKKNVLLGGAGLVAGSLLLFDLARTAPAVMVFAFTLGAGGSALVTGANAAVSDLFTEKREAALNLLNFFFGVGAFVTPFAIVPLEQTGGLRAVLATLVIIAVFSFLFSAAVRFPAPLRGSGWSFAEATSLARQPHFLQLGAVLFLYVGIEISIWNWQVTFLIDRFGAERYLAARVLSGFAITLMIGRLLSSRVLMLWAPRPVLLVSTAAGAVSLGLAYSLDHLAIAIGSFLAAGLFLAGVFPTAVGLLGRNFPQLSGTATGLGITCAWLGALVVPPAVGYMAAAYGLQRGTLLISSAAVLLCLLAAIVYRQQTPVPASG
jgi:fucose permease